MVNLSTRKWLILGHTNGQFQDSKTINDGTHDGQLQKTQRENLKAHKLAIKGNTNGQLQNTQWELVRSTTGKLIDIHCRARKWVIVEHANG